MGTATTGGEKGFPVGSGLAPDTPNGQRTFAVGADNCGMERICVYCGASEGHQAVYKQAAAEFGRTLVERDLGLVYGGGDIGLMGAIANAVLESGGEARGVIPQALVDREQAHDGLTELDVVESMHARKARMVELADGFVALPGGYGTLEELLEVLTWAQLGFHQDPCGLLNVEGYYEGLAAFFDHQQQEGFVSNDHRDMLVIAENSTALLDDFERYEPPTVREVVTDIEET
jgi:uncharacterized protein (TIGR00730 family)